MSRVRIVGGEWRSRLLDVTSVPGLRPTPDRVRETLFNWLGQNLGGLRCLDAFAGSGALGFEAASRGAVQVLLCEQDPGLAASLRANAERLKATQIKVQRGDAITVLKGAARASWDLVFLDPPFGDGGNEALFRQALQAAVPLLAPQGCIYLEAPRAWSDEDLLALGLRCSRHGKAGQVHYHLLELAPAT